MQLFLPGSTLPHELLRAHEVRARANQWHLLRPSANLTPGLKCRRLWCDIVRLFLFEMGLLFARAAGGVHPPTQSSGYDENTDSHSSATGVATTTPSKPKVWPLVAKHLHTP